MRFLQKKSDPSQNNQNSGASGSTKRPRSPNVNVHHLFLRRHSESKSVYQFTKVFKDKLAHRQYKQNHTQASHCLPSTAEGEHPALVLVNQKGLVCSRVCQERIQNTAQVFQQVEEVLTRVETDDKERTKGKVDEAEFRRVLGETIQMLSGEETGEDILDDQMDLLMHFVPWDKDRLVAEDTTMLKAKLLYVLTLWALCVRFKEQWLLEVKLPLRKGQLLRAMTDFNQGEFVKMKEALWIREKFSSIHCRHAVEETKLLLCIAHWYSAPPARPTHGLNRKQLILRIELERRLAHGFLQFVLWIGIFLLLTACLTMAAQLEHCRGIKVNLETQLKLESAAEATTMNEVSSYAEEFSERVTRIAPLSLVYFGGGGVWTLQEQEEVFTNPVALPILLEPTPNPDGVPPSPLVLTAAFTLQAWVGVDTDIAVPRFGLSLLRRALGNSAQLSCWAWRIPPALSYGAHDYGNAYANSETGLFEEYIAADEWDLRNTSEFALHTLIVDERMVTFMVDDRVLSRKVLPRPVTDCYSTASNTTLGDRGLTLASVRFYPRNLSVTEVGQIFRAGSTWQEIGYVISPQKMKAVSEVASQSLRSQTESAQATYAASAAKSATWTSSVLSASGTRDSSVGVVTSSQEPYSNLNHPIYYREADPTLGVPYYEIYGRPIYTDQRSQILSKATLLPNSPGRGGFTLSTWLKFDSYEGSGYLMSPALPIFTDDEVKNGTTNNPLWRGRDAGCWGIFLGGRSTGFATTQNGDVLGGGPGPTYLLDDWAAPENWQLRGKAYRHLVFQMIPEDTERPLRICVDGKCTGKAVIDSYAQSMNSSGTVAATCAQTGAVRSYDPNYAAAVLNQSRLYLSRRAVDNYHLTAWLAQTKYFDRVLSEENITELFENDPDPEDPQNRSFRENRGCRYPHELQNNVYFKDDFGHDCYWYFQARQDRPQVCDNPEVQQACPVVCSESCWGTGGAASETMQIWNQQMEFRTRGAKGTMCVAKSTTAEAEAIKCALYSSGGTKNCSGQEGEQLLECLGDETSGRGEDTNNLQVRCKDIILLNMPACAWDDSIMDKVVSEMGVNQGWSMSFWYKMLATGCTIPQGPQIRLLGGPGTSTFAWTGGLGSLIDDREAAGGGWLPNCSTDPWLAFGHYTETDGNLDIRHCSVLGLTGTTETPFHFMVIGRQANGSIGISVDASSDIEVQAIEGQPIPRDKSFLRAINFGGNLRVSSITLRPDFPSKGQLGRLRFSELASQQVRTGPSQPLQEMLRSQLEREPQSYAQKTMLLVPAFLLQKRAAQSDCPSTETVVNVVYERGSRTQCTWPYTCPGYGKQTVYSCQNPGEDTTSHFGHPPVVLGDEHYFMEFLASVTDNAVLMRSGELRPTEEFLDILTKEATIVALFYSVEFEITTLLKLRFDASKGRVHVTTSVEHFAAVPRDLVLQTEAMLIACLVLAVLVVLDLVPSVRKQVKLYKKDGKLHWPSLRISIGDAVLGVSAFALVMVQLLQVQNSRDSMQEKITALVSFDWRDHTGMLEDVKEDFMRAVSEVEEAIETNAGITAASTILSIILLVRVVYATSAHPRVGLITRTLELAGSDLVHFFGLTVVIFAGFAVLGTWMFGAERDDFGDPVRAFLTLCDSVLGPPGALLVFEADKSVAEFAYVFLFHFICFFFLLNFILAIIIDAYTKVMDDVHTCIVDQNIILDLLSILEYSWRSLYHRFPVRLVIESYLKGLDVEALTFDDLWGNELEGGDEIFANAEAASSFIYHYSKYSFLHEDSQSSSTDPTSNDMAMIMALTMHKVEMAHLDMAQLSTDVSEIQDQVRGVGEQVAEHTRQVKDQVRVEVLKALQDLMQDQVTRSFLHL